MRNQRGELLCDGRSITHCSTTNHKKVNGIKGPSMTAICIHASARLSPRLLSPEATHTTVVFRLGRGLRAQNSFSHMPVRVSVQYFKSHSLRRGMLDLFVLQTQHSRESRMKESGSGSLGQKSYSTTCSIFCCSKSTTGTDSTSRWEYEPRSTLFQNFNTMK